MANFTLFYYFKDYNIKISDNFCRSSVLEIVKLESKELIEFLLSHQLIESNREYSKCGQEATIKINKGKHFYCCSRNHTKLNEDESTIKYRCNFREIIYAKSWFKTQSFLAKIIILVKLYLSDNYHTVNASNIFEIHVNCLTDWSNFPGNNGSLLDILVIFSEDILI